LIYVQSGVLTYQLKNWMIQKKDDCWLELDMVTIISSREV
jgi:hypothetical protein